MSNVNDETNKVKIPCDSEGVYREINRLRRMIKPEAEKVKKDNSKKPKKSIFKRSKKAQLAYEEQQENLILLAYMNDAVEDTYYSIAGFRYYAEKLHIYVASVMPAEESKEDIFICAYNSSIYCMERLYDKLEKKINEYDVQRKTGDTFKNELLTEMKRFTDLSRERGLDKKENFSLEEYKTALKEYSELLKTEFTDKYTEEEEKDNG